MNMKNVYIIKSTQDFSTREVVTVHNTSILGGASLVLSLTRVPGSSYYSKLFRKFSILHACPLQRPTTSCTFIACVA